MPTRSCVTCRASRPAEELIRLALVSPRRLVPDLEGRLPGRGAWVCPTRACVDQVSRRPRVLGRALKADPGPGAVTELGADLRRALLAELHRLLLRAWRSGSVVAGAGALAAGAPGYVAVVLASDASALTAAAARARCEDAVVADISLDRLALGRLIGRGPRAVLAVRAGTPGDELAYRLRCLCALG